MLLSNKMKGLGSMKRCIQKKQGQEDKKGEERESKKEVKAEEEEIKNKEGRRR